MFFKLKKTTSRNIFQFQLEHFLFWNLGKLPYRHGNLQHYLYSQYKCRNLLESGATEVESMDMGFVQDLFSLVDGQAIYAPLLKYNIYQYLLETLQICNPEVLFGSSAKCRLGNGCHLCVTQWRGFAPLAGAPDKARSWAARTIVTS